eukprot:scaffold20867_cov66-Phaeocystis_antarctica.AAC.2
MQMAMNSGSSANIADATWMCRAAAWCHLRITKYAHAPMRKVMVVAPSRPIRAMSRSTAGVTSVDVSCCGTNMSRSRPGAIISSTISTLALRDFRGSGSEDASTLASSAVRRSFSVMGDLLMGDHRRFGPPPASPCGVSGVRSLAASMSASSSPT